MQLNERQIKLRLKKLGLINEGDEPVLYSKFKNRASVHRYRAGRGVRIVVYIGQPNVNLFGFYHPFNGAVDSQVMKEAYERFSALVRGDLSDFEAGGIQWGNCAIPEKYEDLTKN